MKKLILFLFLIGSLSTFSQEVPKLETYTLKNGLKIYLMQYGKIPAVHMRLVINAGKKNEAPGQQGYSEITSALLLLGNSKYTEEEQNNLAFVLGGDLSSNSGKDYTSVSANFLSKDIDKGMDLFSSAILKPLFKKERVEQIISYYKDYNNPSKMDISALASVFGNLFLYGIENPLGRNYYKSQLQKITPEMLREFHKFNYAPKNASVIICGNFNADEVKQTVEKYFASWQSEYGEVNGVSLNMPQIKKKEIAFIHRSKATQCALQWIKTAPSLKDKDLQAFEIANYIFNRLLFVEIREKGGKTYSIGSSHSTSRFSNLMQIGCSVRNNEMLNTINLFDKTLQDFSMATITSEDVDNAKRNIKTTTVSSEMPESVLNFYNPLIYDFQKRKNYIADLEIVTFEDVKKAIKKYYTPSVYKLIIAGDELLVAEQLNKINGLVKLKPGDIEKDN